MIQSPAEKEHAQANKERDERLNKALRDNLKRRKVPSDKKVDE